MDYTELIQAMTLEEKCALLSGKETFVTRGYKKYGIPPMRLSDGPHGLRKQAGESDHLGLNASEPATCFPTAAAVANSWNPALGEEIGQALGEEAAAQGVGVLLGPGLNMKRSPLCGRSFEYFAEDPYLAGKLAAGYVRGIQANGISACPKHFAVNSQELRRMSSDSIVDERTLREIYLTGFEIAVKEGNPNTIMSSYNLVNGEYANENRHLLMDILRNEWGFQGAVVTDWGGSNDHALGVKNGSTLEMPAPGGDSIRELIAAVQCGKVSEEDVDARLQELLELVFSTRPAVEAADSFDVNTHHALARKAAEQCIVLLKNEENILPLVPGTRVAVIGDFAETPRYQGAGSSVVNPTMLDTIKGCFAQSGLEAAGFARGYQRHGEPDEALKAEAVELAQKTEYVLLCLGLDEIQESEGMDRTTMKLAQNQIDLLLAVSEVCDNVIILFHSGSVVEMPWLDQCKALVYASLGGQAGAGALLDVVAGKINPSGKLAETWPRRYADTPAADHFPGREKTTEYREGLYIGYRYYDTAGVPVCFPFGYGLSYTSFAYSNLAVNDGIVTLTVTNTGKMAGAEIVQLYIAKPDAKIFRPAKELKGFARVELAAGESKRVAIPLDDKAFRYWNVRTDRWEIEGGDYEILVGASSADIRAKARMKVVGTEAPDPYYGQPVDCYRTGQIQNVPDDQFAALLRHPIPNSHWQNKLDRNTTFGEMDRGKSPLGWLVCKILGRLKANSEAKGKPDLNILFIYNMPLRALAKMTSGSVSMEMVDGMVAELNGLWLIGLVRVLVAYIKNVIANRSLEKRLKQAEEGE